MSQERMDSTLPVEEEDQGETRGRAWGIEWSFPSERAFTSELKPGRLTIGRDASCDVVLASSQVSRQHAALVVEGNAISLEDLGSRNGTHVEGTKVAKRLLHDNDLIRIGDWLGMLVRLEPKAEPVELPRGYAGPVLSAALRSLQRGARTDLPVILQGPTGSGKECVAHALHEWSGRPGRLVAVNCSAIPEQLAEAELFGYRRGAFTGAETAAVGYIRAADGGTLLLDEIADLPLTLQAKLLRAIEQQEVQGLGEARPTSVNVRLVVASQVPLAELVASRKFRADLLARLNGITAKLPSLAERRREIPGLFVHLLTTRGGGTLPALDAQLVERLCLYTWPGNVRELDLLVRRLLGLHGHEPRLRLAHLAETELEQQERSDSSSEAQLDSRSRDERDVELLVIGLTRHAGNIAKAADAARISRQRAYRLLQARPELDLESFRKQTSQ